MLWSRRARKSERFVLLAAFLLVMNGCSNCGEKEEMPVSAPTKPEKPVVRHSRLPDGGRGKPNIVDIAEHPSIFEAGTVEDPP